MPNLPVDQRKLRAIIGARVSVMDKDGKVSHDAQTKTNQKFADDHGYEVVGSFQDLGVSAGKYKPVDRPGLGPWLKDHKLHEWDVLVFTKVDRAFRSTRDCVDFARWCEENKKVLVFSQDGFKLDYRNEADMFERKMSEFFIQVASFFGELELARFVSRSTDTHAYIRPTDKFTGKPPYGFKTAEHPSGKGKCLVHDSEQQKVIQRLGNSILSGQSMTALRNSLNADGIPSREGKTWATKTIKMILTSPATQGYKLHQGKTVLDSDGMPIQVGPASFDNDTWELIQDAIAKREYNGKRRTHSENPLRGIGFCAICMKGLAQRVHTRHGKTYKYAVCYNGCKGITCSLDSVETFLGKLFLARYGNKQQTKQVFVPGSDNSAELAEVKKSLARLRQESDNGWIDDEQLWASRMDALTARKRKLEAEKPVQAHWETVTTGKTFSEVWNDPETDRRQMLEESGIKFYLTEAGSWQIEDPKNPVFSQMRDMGVAGIEIDGGKVTVHLADGRSFVTDQPVSAGSELTGHGEDMPGT